MSGSFLPSLWSSNSHSLLGSRSRHCYAIKFKLARDLSGNPTHQVGRDGLGNAVKLRWGDVLPFAFRCTCRVPHFGVFAVFLLFGFRRISKLHAVNPHGEYDSPRAPFSSFYPNRLRSLSVKACLRGGRF